MTKNERILFIHHGVGLGGAPKSMAQLANRLKADGRNVEVLYLKDSSAKTLLKSVNYHIVGLPLLYFNHSSRWYRWFEIHLILYQILSWLLTVLIISPYWYLKLKPTVIYLNSSVLTDWLLVSKVFHIRNVLHVREAISKGYFNVRNSLMRLLISKCADDVIFLSKHNLNCLNGKLKSRKWVISNYVKKADQGYLEPEIREFDVIYVGGEREIKGIDLIKSFITKSENLKICLLGYYSSEFVKKYSGGNVTVVGAVEDAIPYIENSRCLLFPATTPHFPRPVIEAMSCGCIPVMSDLDGYEEIIVPGESGFVFQNSDVDSLIQAVGIALSNCTKKTIKSCVNRYLNNFSQANEDRIVQIILSN